MEQTRIGLLHPGQMGSAVGRVLAGAGHRVLWVSADRSPVSCERAAAAGLEDAGSLQALAAQAEVILSICPPHAASAVAEQVAAAGFTGIYADCNAISPRRTRAVEATIAGAGATCVDGGIVGGPPAGGPSASGPSASGPPRTSLYLSGAAAGRVAACFPAEALHAPVLSDRIGAASALKMCYAANTKGTSALFASILALAEREGVRDALERQWGPGLTAAAHRRAADSALKAWRFAGEMREISATFADAGLPGGFHAAAAEIYERLAPFKGRSEPPQPGEVLGALPRAPGSRLPSGDEPFHAGGVSIGATVLDYWRWSGADLLSNGWRGVLAEFLIARALDVTHERREEWAAYDLRTRSDVTVEVKSAAYVQTWKQHSTSLIAFDIAPRKQVWDPATNETIVFPKPKRIADVYVFCVLGRDDLTDLPDPLDVDQWAFYVLGRAFLDRERPVQKTIVLNAVRSLMRRAPGGPAGPVRYGELRAAIERAAERPAG